MMLFTNILFQYAVSIYILYVYMYIFILYTVYRVAVSGTVES